MTIHPRGWWRELRSGPASFKMVSSWRLASNSRFREALQRVTESAAAADSAVKVAKPSLAGFSNTVTKVGRDAAEAKDPFDALLDSITKTAAAFRAETVAGEKLTEGQKKAVEALDQLRTGKLKEGQHELLEQSLQGMLAMGIQDEYSAKVLPFVDQVAQSVGSTLDGLAKTFGKVGGYQVTTAYADDSSKDPSFAQFAVSLGGKTLVDWNRNRTDKWAPRNFADGEEGQKLYLAEKRLMSTHWLALPCIASALAMQGSEAGRRDAAQ
ncbi:MAG: hypothetical protein R3F09_17190 [Burkholderiaceae bacterium]